MVNCGGGGSFCCEVSDVQSTWDILQDKTIWKNFANGVSGAYCQPALIANLFFKSYNAKYGTSIVNYSEGLQLNADDSLYVIRGKDYGEEEGDCKPIFLGMLTTGAENWGDVYADGSVRV